MSQASEVSQIAADISAKIAQLEDMSGENLKAEMGELKKALLQNPAACMLLKDEDIGSMVTSLRRMTGIALSASTVKKVSTKTDRTKVKLTAADLQAALNSEDF